MAYFTYAHLQTRFGAPRVAELVAGSEVSRQAVIEGYADAASAEVDAAADEGGITTPLPTTGATGALIRENTISLVMWRFIQPFDHTDEVKAERERCNAWLDMLRQGKGLPTAAAKGADPAIDWIAHDSAKVYSPVRVRNARGGLRL